MDTLVRMVLPVGAIRLSRWKRSIGLVAGVAGTILASAAAADNEDVKAAFIFRLASMTRWPPRALGPPESAVCVMIIGNEAIARALRDIAQGRTLHDRPLEVRSVDEATEETSCPVVFVDDRADLPPLEVSGGRPVLLIGDGDGFADRGGMIQFVREGRHLRFIVNRRSLDDRALKLSSQVLRLARRIIE